MSGTSITAGRDIGKVIVIHDVTGNVILGPDSSKTEFSDQLRDIDQQIADLAGVPVEIAQEARDKVAEAQAEAESDEPIGKLISRNLSDAAGALKKAGDAAGGATKVVETLLKIASFAATAAIFG